MADEPVAQQSCSDAAFEIATPSGSAVVDLDRPRAAPKALLVLTHGASGGVDTADLLAIRDAAVRAGHRRRPGPPAVPGRRAAPPAPGQDAAWLAASPASAPARARRATPRRRRTVQRRAGRRAAPRPRPAPRAVVALAFPVHPPGKPETSRLDELDAPACPSWSSRATATRSACPRRAAAGRSSSCRGADTRCAAIPTPSRAHVLTFVTRVRSEVQRDVTDRSARPATSCSTTAPTTRRASRLPRGRVPSSSTSRSTGSTACSRPSNRTRRRCGSSSRTAPTRPTPSRELSDALGPVRRLAARRGRGARHARARPARQPGRAVGDDARRDEARRGDDPGDDAARRRPTCATASTAATSAR